MKKILIPMTNHATLGDSTEANGTYAPELTHALNVFIDQGFDFTLASIEGGNVPIYGTDTAGDDTNTKILVDVGIQTQIADTIAVSDINITEYDAIFYPGGFGLLNDLANDKLFADIAATHYQQGGVIGAVCHGPAALLPITLDSGASLLANKQVTGFTREEEVDFGTISKIPFLLEEHLTRSSYRFIKGQPWGEHIVVDENLVTGQNPASAHGVAVAMVALLGNPGSKEH